MLSAFGKTLGQIGDRRLRKVLFKGIIGAIIVFILTWMVITSVLGSVVWTAIPVIGPVIAWMGATFDILSVLFLGFGIIGLTFILFPAVMTAVMGLFLEEVCDAVEDKHYPYLDQVRDISTAENIGNSLKFLGIILAVNLLALPFYALTWWLGLGILLYYLINGYLLGREYFELVAHRRMSPADARRMRKENKGTVMLFGFTIAFLMTIPFVNLVTPVLATATMVHLFMKFQKSGGASANESMADGITMTGKKALGE